MASRSAGRSGSKWRTVKAYVLDRDGRVCRIGGPGCRVVATTVDHIRTRHTCVTTGTHGTPRCTCDDPTNLRAACAPCNIGRGNRMRSTTTVSRPPSRRHTKTSRQW